MSINEWGLLFFQELFLSDQFNIAEHKMQF